MLSPRSYAEMSAGWNVLHEAIAGDVIAPGDPDYELVRRTPMTRFDGVRPAAVVMCRSAEDIAATLAFARRIELPISIRSGGHSVAGRSSTDGIVIDVTPMSVVAVEAELATVGSGVRLGGLYDALAEHGRTIPAGCGPSVGIAGLTLGGGIGILGRKYGLTCDHLLGAQIVLGDGRVLECDEHRHGDLFWALRGAGGGNFGVVTSFVFRTVPAPPTTVFHLAWPLDRAADLVEAWQEWAPAGPDELDATLRLRAPGSDAPPRADVFGAFLGGETDAVDSLHDLIARARVEPDAAQHRLLGYRAAKRTLEEGGLLEDGGEQTPPDSRHGAGELFTKSEFFRRLLPRDTITALVANLIDGEASAYLREVTFLHWGGAYNRKRADATAFPHRDELFLVQHLLEVTPHASANDRDSGRAWLARSWSLLRPWSSGGVYANFPDPDLEDWEHAYFGENYDRLVEVKGIYDPEGFFRFHQALPSR
jgi:FAD binding domain/Berberine and berberine like